MRTIRAEIQQYMTGGPARENGALTSRFRFPGEFIGFQGHFPQKKILPGVCQIQMALSMMEKDTLSPVALDEIVLAKYFSPVFPDEEVTCIISGMENVKSDGVVKAVISKGTARVAELKLRVSFAGGGR